MKNLTLIATGLLISSTAFAQNITVHKETTLQTYATPSAEQAYEAGYNLIERVKAMPQNELRFTLPSFSDRMVKNIKVSDFEVKIEEFSKERGNTQYRAIVNVNYDYQAYENNK